MPVRILVVEDDALVAASLVNRFETEGYNVDSVGSLSSAKARLAAPPRVDLLALDLILPDGNGIELFDFLAELKTTVPVVVISAIHSDEVRLRAFDAGAEDYVVKPYSLREVAARVHNILKTSRGHLPG
ncbi:MAG: response regulator transcription factor [Hyphomicrobium sp.]|nr:response regulator transcription factor [Hyphomicrobium sp.]